MSNVALYVKKYYTSAYATLQDHFDPFKVIRVCSHIQQTHKGEVFRYANKYEITAYEILKDVFSNNREEVEKENDNQI